MNENHTPVLTATPARDAGLKTWTVQCEYAGYYGRVEVVEAESAAEACLAAKRKTGDDSAWRALDCNGEVFVSAVAEGEVDDPFGASTGVVVPAAHSELALHLSIPFLTEHADECGVYRAWFEDGESECYGEGGLIMAYGLAITGSGDEVHLRPITLDGSATVSCTLAVRHEALPELIAVLQAIQAGTAA